MGAIFSVRKDALVSFYEQHDAQYADHTDQFLQEYSAQELVDWCQEAYGGSPTTTPKTKGALFYLNVGNNDIAATGVEELDKMVRGNRLRPVLEGIPKSLTELDLHSRFLDDKDAVVVADAIKDMRAMTSLNLASNELGVEGAKIIAACLPKCT
jgi:hypothetical protein